MQFHSLLISLFSKDLYSTSLRLLLRGAPESSTLKITLQVECVIMENGNQQHLQWESFPYT